MEKIVVHNDGSVRCVSSKRIYKETFGEDGIDPCRRVLDPNRLKRAIYRAQLEDCLGKTLRKTTSVIWSGVFFESCDLIQKYFGQRESKKVFSFGSAFRVRAI